MPRHLNGGKFTRSHTTVTESAERVIQIVEKLPVVTKISIGQIHAAPSSKTRLKFVEIPAGLKLSVTGSRAVQDFYIFTTDRISVIEKLKII